MQQREPFLFPGIDMTDEQVFFLSYAQTWSIGFCRLLDAYCFSGALCRRAAFVHDRWRRINTHRSVIGEALEKQGSET